MRRWLSLCHNFTLAVFRAVAQLLVVRPHHAFMKTGDLIAISIINQAGRSVDTVSKLRLEGGSIFADVTPEAAGGALKMAMNLDIIPDFIEPQVGDVSFRYRGEIRGAVFVPDNFWT